MIEEEVIYEIVYEVVSGIEALHLNNISHRDIKLENVLQNSKSEWKLCDFGSTTSQVGMG